MKPLTSLLVLMAGVLVFATCKKNNTPPPDNNPPTQKILKCKINGQNWETTDVRGGFFYRPSDNFYYIYIYSYRGDETISLYLNKPYSNLNRLFNQNTLSKYFTAYPMDYGYFERYNGGGDTESFITSSIDTGRCTIVYMDSLNRAIKCRFNFKARNQSNNQILEVTEGYLEGYF